MTNQHTRSVSNSSAFAQEQLSSPHGLGQGHGPARAESAHTRKSSSSNQEQNQNLSSEGRPPVATTPRQALEVWFWERFHDRADYEPLSISDLGYIDQWLAHHVMELHEFIHICRRRATGKNVLNPIALVKHLAKTIRASGFPPRWISPPPPEPEWGSCQTCRNKAGLLADNNPCPDCKLGQDLARQKAKAAAPSRPIRLLGKDGPVGRFNVFEWLMPGGLADYTRKDGGRKSTVTTKTLDELRLCLE